MKDANAPGPKGPNWPPERGTAEAMLRESEERFRAFVNASSDVVFRMNADWSEMRELDGKGVLPDITEPTPNWMDRHIVPEDRKSVRQAIDWAVQTRSMFELEHRVIRADGTHGWTFTRAVPTLGEAGEISEWLGTAKDITDSKRADIASRTREEQFREQFENANDFIFTADLDMRITSGNPAVARALGHTPEELIGHSISEFVPPEMWARNKAMLAAKLAGDTDTTRYEVEVFDAHGERMTWEINSRLTRDASGAPTGLHAIGRDVTERKASELALLESEERFRRIADSTPTPMWVTRLDRKREFVNRAYVEFLGISYEEAVDFDWRAILHPEDHDRIVAESIAGEASLQEFVLEARYRRKDGEWHWMRSTSQPRFGADGELTGFIGVAHDITGMKTAEAALREAGERAASEAAERSAILGQLTEGVIVTDAGGRIIFVNEAATRLHGVAALDVEPSAYAETYRLYREDGSPHPFDELPLARAVMNGETVSDARWRIRRPDGSEVLAIGSAQPIRDREGGQIGSVLTVRDDTRRYAAEEALRDSEERFRTVFENAGIGMIEIDADWRILGANTAYSEIAGQSSDELIGQSSLAFTHPDDIARSESELREAAASESGRVSFEKRYLRKDGGVVWIRSNLARISSGDSAKRFLKIVEDITARKQAEDSLRGREQHLRLIYDSLDEYAIFTLDRRGVVTSWNEGATRLLGYSEAEAIGMNGCDIFTPEDRRNGEADREIETALSEGRAANERWHVRKDGSRFWGSGAVLSMLDGEDEGDGGGNGNGNGSGEPVLVKIMRDDTQRVLEEERQKLLLSELQHRVRNTLGIVRSIARQSKRGQETVDDYVNRLVGRLDALARTQVLLTREAGARVDIRDLVCEELLVQACDQERFVVHGPEVSVPAKAAEVLTLAVHELATNATKYGALSTSDGRLSVTWTLDARADGEWLDMQWTEQAGRTMAPPTRTGFGTELIERRVPYELRGEASMDFTREGLRARIAFPLVDAASVLESGPGREMGR